MLDSDIARLYNAETKRINEAVKRNIKRFPEDFCFQLSKEETSNLSLRSQIATSKELEKNGRGGNRYLPYAFTEQGVAMLSALLNSDIAINMSIKIMNAFVSMRRYLSSNTYEKRLSNVETKVIEYDNKFNIIMDKLDKTVNNHLFYEGQIYDAYSVVIDIFNKAKKEIIIIDNYLDKNMLDIISKAKVKVTLITANKLDNLDLVKYNKQYSNLNVIIDNRFHDRFIVLDKELFYHLGSSLNSIGKKCFAIVKFEETETINKLISIINSI